MEERHSLSHRTAIQRDLCWLHWKEKIDLMLIPFACIVICSIWGFSLLSQVWVLQKRSSFWKGAVTFIYFTCLCLRLVHCTSEHPHPGFIQALKYLNTICRAASDQSTVGTPTQAQTRTFYYPKKFLLSKVIIQNISAIGNKLNGKGN